MILINQFTFWSLVFDNYLRFEICDLLFGTLRHCVVARNELPRIVKILLGVLSDE